MFSPKLRKSRLNKYLKPLGKKKERKKESVSSMGIISCISLAQKSKCKECEILFLLNSINGQTVVEKG